MTRQPVSSPGTQDRREPLPRIRVLCILRLFSTWGPDQGYTLSQRRAATYSGCGLGSLLQSFSPRNPGKQSHQGKPRVPLLGPEEPWGGAGPELPSSRLFHPAFILDSNQRSHLFYKWGVHSAFGHKGEQIPTAWEEAGDWEEPTPRASRAHCVLGTVLSLLSAVVLLILTTL